MMEFIKRFWQKPAQMEPKSDSVDALVTCDACDGAGHAIKGGLCGLCGTNGRVTPEMNADYLRWKYGEPFTTDDVNAIEVSSTLIRGISLLTLQKFASAHGIPWAENLDHEKILYLYYKKKGMEKLHYCPDWDYMAIHSTSPEFEACLCDKESI